MQGKPVDLEGKRAYEWRINNLSFAFFRLSYCKDDILDISVILDGDKPPDPESEKETKCPSLLLFEDLVERIDKFTPLKCEGMDIKERKEFLKTGKIWITQLTMGNKFAPMQVGVFKPENLGEYKDPEKIAQMEKAAIEQAKREEEKEIEMDAAIKKENFLKKVED